MLKFWAQEEGMDEQDKKLKCRFCKRQFMLYVRKGGEVKDNWPALIEHVASRHPSKFVMIQRSLVDVRAKLRSLGGDEAVGRFPRKGLGQEKVRRIIAVRGDELPELCFDEG